MAKRISAKEVISHFRVPEAPRAEAFGNGHINETYITGGMPYVLQRINTNVFRDPDGLMENISAVTSHLRKKAEKNGIDPDRATLSLIPTLDGKRYWRAEDGSCWRMYVCLDARSYDRAESPAMLRRGAEAFGRFTADLADFPAESLHETIPHFHDTPVRFEALDRAIADDVMGRRGEVQAEIDLAMQLRHYGSLITDGLADGSIPYRVTHNDTKINNVLFGWSDGLCTVIDLDTVMPGSLLCDFGDGLRTGAALVAEDELEYTKAGIDLTLFRAFAEGYVKGMGGSMTEKERSLLPESVLILSLECGIRFLTDFLSGDTYFRIHRPRHNLDRARTQLHMCLDIEKKLPEMHKIIDDLNL